MASPSSGSPLQSPCPQASSPVPPVWTREEEKVFETALVSLDLGSADCWQGLTAVLPGKDAASLKNHFDTLLEDVESIEAGLIALPPYPDTEEVPGGGESSRGKKEGHLRVGQVVAGAAAVSIGSGSGKGPSSKSSEIERRKGIPWTEEEHKSFLLGLAKFGKGDWRSISRNFVRTRTPTQVASHAQKYFIRLNSIKKDRRRSSIHDITSVNGDAAQSGQGPITGQGIAGHSSSSASGLSEGPVFGAAVGQPISGSLSSTVGTPVMIPSTGFTGPYVSGAPLPRPLIPGAPVGVMQVPYSLAQPVPQPPQQVGRL